MTDEAAQQAFSELVGQLRSPLLAVARRIVLDRCAAEDVVQDTLVAVLQQWSGGSLRDPTAYAFRAVTLNAIKYRSRRRVYAPLNAAEGVADRRADVMPLDASELERAIASLPMAQQTVIRMKYYTGLSFREIGKSLSISSNTVASRCRYAMTGLRSQLTTRPVDGRNIKEILP